MKSIAQLLHTLGPSRASLLAEHISDGGKTKPEAARQRLSRAQPPVRRFPFSLLPKREGFFYLEEQRNTERYWTNLHRDLRATGSIYGIAVDSFFARGGVVPIDEFGVISGAPSALKGQVPNIGVSKTLRELGVMEEGEVSGLGPCYVANPYAIGSPEPEIVIRTRQLVESVILDGLREWLRNNGFASYDKIAIRGDDHPRMVGQLKWDLTAPSYLMPLRGQKTKNGFVVADVFSDIRIDVAEARYFVRKAQLYRQTAKSGQILPMLMADSFTGAALTYCHQAGIVPCTPAGLFGKNVGGALLSLTDTLKKAAGVAINDPERLYTLIDKLSEIEGAAGNMRGILFELIAAHLIKMTYDGGVDLAVRAKHAKTGETADIDVMCVTKDQIVRAFETKGRSPGGTVGVAEVERWLKKIAVMQSHFSQQPHLSSHAQQYMLWTTGTFEPDALALLEAEKLKRTKRPIFWSDGAAVRDLAKKLKSKAIGKALDEHFLKHPIVEVLAGQ